MKDLSWDTPPSGSGSGVYSLDGHLNCASGLQVNSAQEHLNNAWFYQET